MRTVYDALSVLHDALLTCPDDLMGEVACFFDELAEQPGQPREVARVFYAVARVAGTARIHVQQTLANADPNGLWADPRDAGFPVWGPSTLDSEVAVDVVEPGYGLADDQTDDDEECA